MNLDRVKVDEEGRHYIERFRSNRRCGIARSYGEIKACRECGNKFFAENRKLRVGAGKYCSNKCQTQFSNHPGWKGGRSVRNYIQVKSPYATREHRIVMERVLGRKLLRTEIVHHIDGNGKNNHPDNLQVMSQSQHLQIHKPWERKR